MVAPSACCPVAGHGPPASAGLQRAVLPGVQNVKPQQGAEVEPTVQARVGSGGHGRRVQGQVLVHGLEGRRPALEKLAQGQPLRVVLARPVVVDLVVIRGEDPWGRRVRGLKVRVALVEGVAGPVLLERARLRRVVAPDEVGPVPGSVFIDVVAEVDDERRRLLGHVAIARVPPALVVLAGDEDEVETIGQGAAGGGGAGAADLTRHARGVEAVPVVAFGLEAGGLHMHGVAELRQRRGFSASHHGAEGIVRRDLPADGKCVAGIAGQVEQARPEYDPIGRGFARRDAESERKAVRRSRAAGARDDAVTARAGTRAELPEGKRRQRAQGRRPRPGGDKVAPRVHPGIERSFCHCRNCLGGPSPGCQDAPTPFADPRTAV